MNIIKQILAIIIFILCLISLSVTLISCEEEIQLELNNPENQRIVVEGRITSELGNQPIRITQTLSYFENELAPPVTDAEVYIVEEGSGEEFPLHLIDDSLGIYQTNSVAGQFGENYSLIINHGDESYKATSYLDTVPLIDSITFEYQYLTYFGFSFGIYVIKMSFYEPPPEGQYYRIDIYLNDTLYTDEIVEPVYLSDFQINDKYLANIELYSIPQERIKLDTNVVRLEMFSISEDELIFLGELINETYGNGSIFSGPPANIESNIENTSGGLDGIGFFGASGVSKIEAVLIKQHDDSTNNPFIEID